MTFIVGIAGKKGAGKDTAGEILANELDFTIVKFAAPLKLMLSAYLSYRGASDEIIHRMLEGDLKEVPSKYFNGKTTRYAMQTLGTEWGRNLIHEDLWIDTFEDKSSQYARVAVTDTRFPNEVNKIFDLDGIVIKIERDAAINVDEHASEALVDGLTVDHIVTNNSSIDSLQAEILGIVEEELDYDAKLPDKLV